MKKIIFLIIVFILFYGCDLYDDFESITVKYQAVGNLMDIKIITYNDYYQGFVELNFQNWIGEFNYTTEFKKSGNAYISATNLNGNEIIAAIYKRGCLIAYDTNINFVELQESINE